MGDVHQPLHVSFTDDRGGNAVDARGPCADNLHAVWDTCLVGLWLPSPVSSAETVDNPTPPPQPRPRLASATDVSARGAMTTCLSVALPAARGPVLSIGLTYSSGDANGIAGVGWHLSGFPAIVRARDTGMNFNVSDQFVFLPGGWGTPEDRDSRLVNASGNYYRKNRISSNSSWDHVPSSFS